eukprot:11275152-Alexandrium_andersonii.AAC.1
MDRPLRTTPLCLIGRSPFPPAWLASVAPSFPTPWRPGGPAGAIGRPGRTMLRGLILMTRAASAPRTASRPPHSTG